MGFLSKFWPTILGVIFVSGGLILFWPNEGSNGNASSTSGTLQPLSEADTAERSHPDLGARAKKEKTPHLGQSAEDRLRRDGAGLKNEMRETLVAKEIVVQTLSDDVELSEKDPQVQQALREIEVVLFEADWCENCKKAREFMEKNSIEFLSQDVESDTAMKEKARRLSGGTSIPVIVIDGKVSVGFSVGSFQQELASALKNRISSP